jgi:hypothetical protein
MIEGTSSGNVLMKSYRVFVKEEVQSITTIVTENHKLLKLLLCLQFLGEWF